MKLVKIKEDLYLNSDFIESVEADGEESTLITMVSGEVFSPNIPIKKVLDAICGSEEHSFIGYKRLKNNDLVQKAYVDVNNICGSEEHLVNDANMNILKAESINSGHLNQQKYPFR